ncbi:MAG: DUF1289 domain-containing protein [Rhodobacteraceae bacterium]|jgi:predicted Fe-S protein YdhL (DUF1289 family)|nr:DUF1289 domain-containing protein [Paracoccaceae bacterium]
MAEAEGAIASPCIRVCVVHPAARICVGCHRTIDEIAAWGQLDPAARAAIMAELPGRRALLRQRRGGRTGRAGG